MGTTTNYSWTYPTVNADADAWGTILNNMAIAIDASLKTVDTATGAKLAKASNLSDLASASTARTNLGLGSAAIQASTDSGTHSLASVIGAATANHIVIYNDTNGSLTGSGVDASDMLRKSQNLSGLASASTSRTNLGLGSIATHNVTISTSAPSGGSDGDIWFQYA